MNQLKRQLLLLNRPTTRSLCSTKTDETLTKYSCLYPIGKIAQSQCAILKPHLDFKSVLEGVKKTEFRDNLRFRRVVDQFEYFEHLDEIYQLYENLSEMKQKLESSKSFLVEKYKNDHQNEQFVLQVRMLKDDLNTVREPYYKITKNLVENFLKLPNFLHKLTPKNDNIEIYNNIIINKSSPNHIDFRVILNEGKDIFYNHDFAIFELDLLYQIEEILLQKQFIQFNNTDFSRRVVLEGAQMIDSDVFEIEQNHGNVNNKTDLNSLYLSGSSSILPFLAYFTKHFLHPTLLPLKLFSLGRHYCNSDDDLFTQQSALSYFIVTHPDNETELEDELFLILNQIIEIYEQFDFPIRVILKAAPNLKLNESLKISIEMFSVILNQFLEIGSVCVYDDFFSKRLSITSTDFKFPKIIAGQLISVQKLFYCIYESDLDLKFRNKIFV